MTKIAWVFPGQGSQTVGMGVDLKDTLTGKTKFEQAEKILGWSVLDKSVSNEEELSLTLYTQPTLYVIEAILADLLQENGEFPQIVAGHSLGEYSALYAARVFDFETGLNLVKCRAELMSSASGGKMVALMKFDRPSLDQIIEDTPDVVLANDNSEQQVVISGIPAGVDQVCSQIKAKRAVPLKVGGAFHSPFMDEASQQFQAVLESVSFADAKVPVLSNVDPTPATNAEILKQRLRAQMTGSVRWREIMAQLSVQEVTQVVEVGPGKVLTGLIKRDCPDILLRNVSALENIHL
ncbi:ACP S-malonyltransferase [Gloeothece verrucosa]|uniref:Malonyl CoA-acyl carrier protein transacylase n=1 Tax=Gloeothece verrucosa (strain PCC 7822) TaxID=497965 RepID=E0U5J4_GLOV7|nr:ACP S-malonyltransferase [Gloeothece verrucosa]ADN14707.1 malonyl CoA-acyl carrier protein transacylase [Gloeothece verrucosa PCC 7822]